MDKKRTYIIAEVGPNHNGNLDLALEMIRRIAPIGVDAIKFQLAVPENVYSKDSFKAAYQKENESSKTPIEMSRKIQLPAQAHLALYEECQRQGVDYLCSAFDLDSLRFLDKHIDMRYYKIPSGEIFSVDTIEEMQQNDRPVILSTGMATFEEIQTSIDLLKKGGKREIIILHCISKYPAPNEDVNLRTMLQLRETFNCEVGFSDHTIGNDAAIAAVALGAVMIEKHITLDKSMEGPDHKASVTVEEFAALVQSIRNVEEMLGSENKLISPGEADIRKVVRKSIVARRDIAEGEVIRAEDLAFKRPGTGYLPIQKDLIIGKKVVKGITADRVILPENIEG